MVKRVASAALWFIATSWAFSYLNLLIDVPAILGPVLAGGVSAFVGLDPLRVIWPARTDTRSPRPIGADIAPRAIPSDI